MIKILTYEHIDLSAWQLLTEQSPTTSWFQTPEAYDFYSSNQEELMPYALGVEEDGVLYGVVVTYITQEKSVLKQYFTCRAIVVGGPLLADDISDEALVALLQAIRRKTKKTAEL